MSADFCDATIRVSRRVRDCKECDRPIKVGDEYLVLAGKYDGDFYSTRNCMRCHRAWQKWIGIFRQPIDGIEIGRFWGWLLDARENGDRRHPRKRRWTLQPA